MFVVFVFTVLYVHNSCHNSSVAWIGLGWIRTIQRHSFHWCGREEHLPKKVNAVDFIKKCLGAPSDTDVEELRAENEELKRKKAELEAQIENLKRDLEAEVAKQQ